MLCPAPNRKMHLPCTCEKLPYRFLCSTITVTLFCLSVAFGKETILFVLKGFVSAVYSAVDVHVTHSKS